MTLHIDPLTAEDWPAVRAIYRQGIATGQATFERKAPSWADWDAAHVPTCRLVAREGNGGAVLGWAALSRASTREVYRGVAEVSVYVAEGHRGQGVGTALLSALVACSEQAGFWTLQASILPENGASLRLHARCGFRRVGVRERVGCLEGRWCDVVWLERRSALVGR